MSAFTDEDLKRAKDELLMARRMEWPFPDAEALIARLESAERCIESLCVDEADMAAWKKACGK